MSKNKIPVSEAIRLLRVYSDIPQSEMAQNIGITSPVLSAMEKGWREITVKTLDKYSDFFGIKTADIIFLAQQIEQNENFKSDVFKSILDEFGIKVKK